MSPTSGTAIYVRISHDPLGLREGVERQLYDCRALARARSLPEPWHVYEDNDVSAYSRRPRPRFTDLLSDLRGGRVSGLVAYNLDRLVRRPSDLEELLDVVQQAGVTHVYTASGDLDLSTHDGQLQARILVAVAKKSSDDTSRRVRRAAEDRSMRGDWHGGQAPYGYQLVDKQLVIDPDEAAVIQDCVTRILNGGSVHAAARAHGLTARNLRRSLLSPALAGLTRLGAPARWPALITDEQRVDLTALLCDPRRRTSQATELKHWLSGLLVCAACNRPMWSNVHQCKVFYQCYGCKRRIIADKTEDYVSGLVLRTIQLLPPKPVENDNEPRKLALEARLAGLAADFADGLITRDEWMVARERLRNALQSMTATQDLQRRHGFVGATQGLAQQWSTLSAQLRRRYAQAVLTCILVGPAVRPQWDSRRLTPCWTDELANSPTAQPDTT